MFKRMFAITAVALLPMAAGATTLIIPAAGTGAGANGSKWETEFVIHNATASTIDFTLTFHDGHGASAAQPFVLGPRSTATTSDVVRNVFGLTQATGAIEVNFDDQFANRVAVTSRTLNQSPTGTFGQDVPAVNVTDATAVGDAAVLSVPAPEEFRLNFGLYAVTASTVNWELIRSDGTIAATQEVSYDAGTQVQYNAGVANLLQSTAQDGDVIYANVTKGSAIAYGSGIDNATGDPTYVPGIRTRIDSHLSFALDINGDGKPDIVDADGDGIADSPVSLYTIGFPNYLRILVNGDGAASAKFELADNSVQNVMFVDNQGTLAWAPFGDLRGTNLTLKVKITVNGVSDVVTIPAVVK